MLKRWLISGLSAIRRKYKRTTIILISLGVVFSLGLGLFASAPANAQLGGLGGGGGGGFGETISTCAVETVGWVICPTMRSVARLADYGFAFINTNYLRIDYDITKFGDSGTFQAWQVVVGIANVFLVLAFLYIVYVQISGRTAGDFNLKRILPRLVLGAILLNLSYFICAGAAQISNIVGSAILDFMVEAAEFIGTPAMSLDNAANGFKDGILTELVSAMLQKSGTAWVMMAPMAAVTIGIATISAATLILLIARKVIVSMMILISPLLFVAYILPNLERFFQQFVRIFIQLLLLYPVLAFLMGAGQIVSATIISAGGGDSDYSVQDDSYQSKSGGSGSAATDLAAAGAAALPLLGAWWMMKGLSSVMSSAGTRLRAGVARGGAGSKERAEKMQAKFGKGGLPSSAASVNITGGRVNVYDRRPGYVSRRRRRATPGGSSLPMSDNKKDGLRTKNPENELGSAIDNLLGGNSTNGIKTPENAGDEAAKRLEDLNNAQIMAQTASTENVEAQEAAIANAASQSATAAAAAVNEKDNKKSANDAFKSLNQRNKPQSKDSERQFGTAQPTAGSGGGGGPSVSSRSNDYRAPVIAQTMAAPVQTNSVASRSANTPITVVDGSTLASQAQPEMARVTAHHDVPTTELQQKATGTAQKYLFDSARDVDDAAQKLEDLTKKREDNNNDNNNEQEAPKDE